MRRNFILALILPLLLIGSPGTALADTLADPVDYLTAKVRENDIVFLGAPHQKQPPLDFITQMIPTLKSLGVTHIGLEIASDQQPRINTFMETGKRFNRIKISKQIQSPAYQRLLEALQAAGGPAPVAIDRPTSQRRGSLTANQWMARSLVRLLPAKIVVVVDNPHTLKMLEWPDEVKRKDQAVREYLHQGNPELKMVSVGQLSGGDVDQCDFTSVFAPLPGAVALDLNRKNQGWKLGFVADMGIVPIECYDLMDGVIVY